MGQHHYENARKEYEPSQLEIQQYLQGCTNKGHSEPEPHGLLRHDVKATIQHYSLDSERWRSGLATSAASAGASKRSIMNQTGYRSTAMVRRYIREGSLFRENAAAVLGL